MTGSTNARAAASGGGSNTAYIDIVNPLGVLVSTSVTGSDGVTYFEGVLATETLRVEVPKGITVTVTNINSGGNRVLAVNDTGVRTVMLSLDVENGVYIQGVSGVLFSVDQWSGQETPNGIAVITDNCRFVMALKDAYISIAKWGGYGTTVSGIVTTTAEATAAEDYKGRENTDTIISALSGVNDGYVTGAPAAEKCKAYTFPNGQVGYMGAVGEWEAAYNNKAAIEAALSACGGTEISPYYWASTQYSSYRSWRLDWYSGLYYDDKSSSRYVRAFAAI